MATTKNITMKQFNGTDYDTLYPKTIVSQVDNALNKTGDTMTGNLTIAGASYPKLLIRDTTNGSVAQIQHFNHILQLLTTEAGSTSNSRQIILSDAVNKASLVEALRLAETKDGVLTYYNILHTGNLEDLSIAKIATGSYVGTGTYGPDNKNSLTFSFNPKFVAIWPDGVASPLFVFVVDKSNYTIIRSSGTIYQQNCSFAGETLSWWTGDGSYGTGDEITQANKSAVTYNYVSFG